MAATRVVIGVDEKYPYSKIVKYAGFVFIKSQIGVDDSGVTPSDTREQTRLALEHIGHALQLAGTDVAKLVKINVYLADIDSCFDQMDEAYESFFLERGVEKRPARTSVGVPLSWPELDVQIDAIAVE